MNSTIRKSERMSLDDFEELLLNRPEDEKWELIDGVLVKGMVGARVEHHIIISNIDYALHDHFKRNGILKKRENDLAALPDVMVRCGKIEPGATSVEDPIVLFEVVSPGSEGKDRLIKRIAYQKLPSLKHYVLVERDRPFIDHYIRTPEGWRGEVPLETLDAVLRLDAIEFEMPVAEIYRDVIAATG